MRAYEVMVILDPSLDERTIEPSLDKYLNVIRKDGGSVESVDGGDGGFDTLKVAGDTVVSNPLSTPSGLCLPRKIHAL